MNELKLKDEVEIGSLIYEIRGKQVMIDSDLAKLYSVETKRINEAVKNNPLKFPNRFCFELNEDEYNSLRSKYSTLSGRGQHRKYLPKVFTEQGVAMLSTILKSKTAIEVSIRIMNAFVAMRHYMSDNLIEQKFINKQVLKNTEDIKLLKETLNKFEEKRKINEIYFNGQIYDAYFKIQEIFKSATKKLIIVDAYADNTILDIIKRLNIEVIIITKKNNLLTNQDITKYNKQYHNLKVIYDAAHVFGVKYKGKSIADYGDMSMFSFHATKVFNTIEGGALIYKESSLKEYIDKLKNFGISGQEQVEYVGMNAKMNEFCAAMGLCNLRHINTELEKRKKVYNRYIERLSNINGIKISKNQENVTPNYAYFPVVFNKEIFGKSRDEVFESLANENIFARKYFYPLINEYECYKDKYSSKDTPVAKNISDKVLTIPMYADLELEEVDRICNIILAK